MKNPTLLFDHIARELRNAADDLPQVQWLMDELTWELRTLRRRLPPADWKALVRVGRAHPLCSMVQEDPITSASFLKHRGYPGDAGLLDLIYGEPESGNLVAAATVLGRSIFARNRNSPSCRAVRYRKALLAQRLSSNQGRALSVACGHLRELRQLGNACPDLHVTAFDQDERSLAEIRKTLPADRVSEVQGSIRQMVSGKFAASGFDFIYAAGLYDYLGVPLARRLTRILFEKLAPNGTLLFTNFTHDTEDAAYMEMFGDWWLLYRDESEMLEIMSAVNQTQMADTRLFRDPDRHLVIVEIRRRESAAGGQLCAV